MSYTREATMRLQQVGTEYDLAAKKFTNDNILPAQASLARMSLNQMIAQIALTKQQARLTEKEVDNYANNMAIRWLQANSQWLSAKSSRNGGSTYSRVNALLVMREQLCVPDITKYNTIKHKQKN